MVCTKVIMGPYDCLLSSNKWSLVKLALDSVRGTFWVYEGLLKENHPKERVLGRSQ